METELVSKLYYSAFGRKLEAKHLSYWTDSIATGEKTIKDFIVSISKTPEYRAKVLARCRTVWCDAGCSMTEFNVLEFDRWFEMRSLDSFIPDQSIYEYVVSTTAFKTKATTTIGQLFAAASMIPSQADSEELVAICQRLTVQNGGFFTVDMVQPDINRILTSMAYIEVDPNVKSIVESDTLNEQTTSQKVGHSLDEMFIEEFETVYKRPIFVQEYLQYLPNYMLLNDPINAGQYICDLYKKHTVAYSRMADLHERFLDEVLKEYDYVKTFLSKVIYDATYIDQFALSLVNTKTYGEKMRATINDTYVTLYDERLEVTDLDFVFERARAARLELRDIQLPEYLAAFKAEADDVAQRMIDIYMVTYDRMPDRAEMSAHCVRYRSASKAHTPFDKVDAEVQAELMMSLEFHDVVKSKLRASAPDMPNSLLFKALGRVLEQLPGKTFVEVEHLVRSMLTSS